MEKQTKNIITREWIEKELYFYNTADIRSTLVLCGALSIVFLPLTIISIYGLCYVIENMLLQIVLSVIIGGFASSPIWINLLSLCSSLNERKLLKNGDFDIVIRDIRYKSEKIVYRCHIKKYLYFDDFKERLVSRAMFDLTSQGDEFYLVHYKTKNSIKLLYSVKMYEYK